MARILGDGQRQKTRAFSELRSHYLFAEKFGRPAKGNDKGKVENLTGYARRNFMVPIPRAASWDTLNAQLAADCVARRAQRLRQTETLDITSQLTVNGLDIPLAVSDALIGERATTPGPGLNPA